MNSCAIIVASAVAVLCAGAAASGAAEPEKRRAPDGEAPKRERPPASALPQKVLKVDEKTITVKPGMMWADQPEPVAETLRIDKERTKVFVYEVKDQEKDGNGPTRMRGTFRAGTLADLKVGQVVRYQAQDGLASEIRIMPPVHLPDAEERRGKR
jgi:hypothetical protein